MHTIPLYPLYNSTFNTHRLTPLYTGQTALLDERALLKLADGFSRVLRGTLFLEHRNDAPWSSVRDGLGSFKSCTWDLLGSESTWHSQHPSDNNDECDVGELSALQVKEDDICGIHVRVEFDRSSYSALLLRDPADQFEVPGFTSLPLLMTRMPHELRGMLLDFLSTTFDTRPTVLKLSPAFLSTLLEAILSATYSKGVAASIDQMRTDLRLQLAFPDLGGSLRNIDITIAEKDIQGFISRGAELGSLTAAGPFTSALSQYLAQHLALDTSHSGVHLSKIVFGAFALSNDGKIKLFSPQREHEMPEPTHGNLRILSTMAVDGLLLALCKEAAALSHMAHKFATFQPRLTQDNSPRDDMEAQQRGPAAPESIQIDESDDISLVERKARQSTVPREPPPPYALYDPSFGGKT